MTESIWLPGLLVLGVGLAAGLTAAWRLRRPGTEKRQRPTAGSGSDERSLRIRDLEERRDELYARLRSTDSETMAPADRQALETAAARALRDLDRLGKRSPAKPAVGRKTKPKAAAAGLNDEAPAAPQTPGPEAAAPGYAARHPFLAGFLFGAGLLALVGVLIYWAVQDAKPDPSRGEPTARQASPEEPHSEGQVPPELTQRLAELEARLAANPGDLLTRKQLALAQLSSNQFFPAFEHATEILRARPEDPDGLYIQGVVRLTMGQNQEAVQLLDRVLADYPSHLQAMLYRGLALFQDGRQQQAIETWETGLEMAGGSHPGFEQLLGMAASGPSGSPGGGGNAPAGSPSAGVAASGPAPTTETASQSAAAATAAVDGFPIRIELASGAAANPNATLFVILLGGPGPPVAVRRLNRVSFPIELVLGQEDSMMGVDLPASGTLTVRLDADGSASTTDDSDLAASAPAERGRSSVLVLQ